MFEGLRLHAKAVLIGAAVSASAIAPVQAQQVARGPELGASHRVELSSIPLPPELLNKLAIAQGNEHALQEAREKAKEERSTEHGQDELDSPEKVAEQRLLVAAQLQLDRERQGEVQEEAARAEEQAVQEQRGMDPAIAHFLGLPEDVTKTVRTGPGIEDAGDPFQIAGALPPEGQAPTQPQKGGPGGPG